MVFKKRGVHDDQRFTLHRAECTKFDSLLRNFELAAFRHEDSFNLTFLGKPKAQLAELWFGRETIKVRYFYKNEYREREIDTLSYLEWSFNK